MCSRFKQEFEVTDDPRRAPAAAPTNDLANLVEEDLRLLGITTEERVSYLWNGYRYSNAADAIAAARRAAG